MEFRFRAKSGNKTFDEPSYTVLEYQKNILLQNLISISFHHICQPTLGGSWYSLMKGIVTKGVPSLNPKPPNQKKPM